MDENEIKTLAPLGSHWVETNPPPGDFPELFTIAGHRWYNTDQNWGVHFARGRDFAGESWVSGRILKSSFTRLVPMSAEAGA